MIRKGLMKMQYRSRYGLDFAFSAIYVSSILRKRFGTIVGAAGSELA